MAILHLTVVRVVAGPGPVLPACVTWRSARPWPARAGPGSSRARAGARRAAWGAAAGGAGSRAARPRARPPRTAGAARPARPPARCSRRRRRGTTSAPATPAITSQLTEHYAHNWTLWRQFARGTGGYLTGNLRKSPNRYPVWQFAQIDLGDDLNQTHMYCNYWNAGICHHRYK